MCIRDRYWKRPHSAATERRKSSSPGTGKKKEDRAQCCHLSRQNLWQKRNSKKFWRRVFSLGFLSSTSKSHIPHQPSLPKILFAKARSVVNKLESVSVTLKQQNIKCLALAETWFNGNHSLEMTQISDYLCFRDDRCAKTRGGVAIWAHSSLQPCLFMLLGKPSNAEAVAVCLMSWLFIICI